MDSLMPVPLVSKIMVWTMVKGFEDTLAMMNIL